MASAKEREAFGTVEPTAPDIDLEIGPLSQEGHAQDSHMIRQAYGNHYEHDKEEITGAWVWILSISACVCCMFCGIPAIFTGYMARQSEKNRENEKAKYWIKILRFLSYSGLTAGFIIMFTTLLGTIIVIIVIIKVSIDVTTEVQVCVEKQTCVSS